MATFLKGRRARRNLPPGSLVHIGERKIENVRISMMNYDEQHCQESVLESVEQAANRRDSPEVTWLNIDGVHDKDVMERTGELFGIHPLVLADIMNTGQRPKCESHENFTFIVVKMLDLQADRGRVISEQVSIVLVRNGLLTFQEAPGDVLDGLRERIRNSKGRIRSVGADYLLTCILGAILEGYYAVLENLSERIEDMEEVLVARPDKDLLEHIYVARRECLVLRRHIRPVREIVASLERDGGLIRAETRPYVRDLYDHAIQVYETTENLRDTMVGMLEMYMSSISNRMNEVMKVLTIIATIFIPLTFIAGIYGMNFDNMPELHWKYSYLVVWIVMVAVAGAMFWFFRRKKWL